MKRVEYRSLSGGLMLTGMGLAFGLAAMNMRLGTLMQMGPGFYPLILSAVAFALGVLLTISSFGAEEEEDEPVQIRSTLAVLGAIAAFALSIRSLGMIPAVFLTVIVAATGDNGSRPVPTLLVAGFCGLAAWLIFVVGLRLPIPAVTGALLWR